MSHDFGSCETVTPRRAAATLGRAGFREARLTDYEGIAALQTRHDLATSSYGEWAALWAENPAYLRAADRPALGWVVEDASGAIVGYLGNLPLAYSFKGRNLIAATVFSWAVDAPHRGYSLRLLDRFLRQANVDLIVCATVNAVSARAYSAFGFAKAPAGVWDTSGYWITGYRGFARAALKSISAPMPGPLAYPVSAGLYVRDVFSSRPRRNSTAGLELCPTFDGRFDSFWDELKFEKRGQLLAVRDRETLDWHFRRALASSTLWIVTASRAGRMAAYAVFDHQDHPPTGLKRIRIADFQALRGSEDLIEPIIAWALEKCRLEKIDMLEQAGCWLDGLRVPGVAPPHRRKLKSWMCYYRIAEKGLARELRQPGVWTPSSYDGDASL
ncbi:MAG: GNAT family N-acetyltransferase [Bryobacteraceae bacterium]